MAKKNDSYTLYDYLDWRGDLMFTENHLNEVDALIFSILSYTDMKKLINYGDDPVTVREMNKRYIKEGIDQSALVYNPAPLLDKCSSTHRFGGIEISHYVDILHDSHEIQFSACTFQLNEETAFVAFRGTDNTVVGWREDFNMTAESSIPAQKHAAEYLSRDFLNKYRTIYTGGHSKGGNLAVYGSAFCIPETRKKISLVFSNDGPGFRPEIWETPEIQAILPKMKKIIPSTSVIGLLLDHVSDTSIISSTLPAFLSHDPYSWKVLGNRFVRENELSSVSKYIINVFNQWISTISDKERSEFIDTVFDTLSESGITKVGQLRHDPIKTYTALYNAFSQSDPKKQQLVTELFARLAKTGTNTAFQELRKSLLQQNPDPDDNIAV